MRPLFVLGGVGAALAIAGCSLTSIDRRDCVDDAGCAAVFGAGYTCHPSGLCAAPELGCVENQDCRTLNGFGSICADQICQLATLTVRCDATFPDRLLEREDLADFVVVGNLMDRNNLSQQAREKAARLAVLQANDAGALGERKLGMVFCNVGEDASLDTLSREEAAVASATWLVDVLGVPAIVGPSSSGDTQAVFNAVRGAGVMVISPSATSPVLTGQDNTNPTDEQPGLLWRTAPPDSEQGRLIADDMIGRGITSVAVVNEVGPYGDELSRVFQEEFKSTENETPTSVIVIQYREEGEIGDVTAQAATLGVEEVLFLSSQSEHVERFLNAAGTNPGFDDTGIFLSDSGAAIDLMGTLSTRFPAIRGTRPQLPVGTTFEAFRASYAAENAGEDVTQFTFAAHAYDAAFLTLLGIAWATEQETSVSGETIARGLRQVSTGTPTPLQQSRWQNAIQAFREGTSIDVEGASGQLDFDPDTEEPGGKFECWRIAEDCTALEEVDCGSTAPPISCD